MRQVARNTWEAYEGRLQTVPSVTLKEAKSPLDCL